MKFLILLLLVGCVPDNTSHVMCKAICTKHDGKATIFRVYSIFSSDYYNCVCYDGHEVKLP